MTRKIKNPEKLAGNDFSVKARKPKGFKRTSAKEREMAEREARWEAFIKKTPEEEKEAARREAMQELNSKLSTAVGARKWSEVERLIKKGARVEVKCEVMGGSKLLHFAVEHNASLKTIKIMVEQGGAYVNCYSSLRRTLSFKDARGEPRQDRGWVTYDQWGEGWTVPMVAAEEHRPDVIRYLYERGADFEAVDSNNGQTAYDIAKSHVRMGNVYKEGWEAVVKTYFMLKAIRQGKNDGQIRRMLKKIDESTIEELRKIAEKKPDD